jgi:hypothetical protein
MRQRLDAALEAREGFQALLVSGRDLVIVAGADRG